MLKTYTTKNETETRAFARRLVKQLKGGDILLLSGELGAGKTTFVKGLAEALEIKEKIKSPTFVLMRIYGLAHGLRHTAYSKSKRAVSHKLSAVRYFVHCDAYRIKNPRELMEAGLADWLGRPDTIVVVEWGEKIKPLIQGKRCHVVMLRHGNQENERIIFINF